MHISFENKILSSYFCFAIRTQMNCILALFKEKWNYTCTKLYFHIYHNNLANNNPANNNWPFPILNYTLV